MIFTECKNKSYFAVNNNFERKLTRSSGYETISYEDDISYDWNNKS